MTKKSKSMKKTIACTMAMATVLNLAGCTSNIVEEQPTKNIVTASSVSEENEPEGAEETGPLELGLGESDDELKEENIMPTNLNQTASSVSMSSAGSTSYVSRSIFPLGGGNAQVLSETDKLALEDAITIVKQRIKIPEKFSEFSYELSNQYDSSAFVLTWSTPEGEGKAPDTIAVAIMGNIIIGVYDSTIGQQFSDTPSFAKLGFDDLRAKAEGYFKVLNPQLNSEVRYEISSLSLYSSDAVVSFKRYENGVYVNDNGGTMVLDKDTGELASFNLVWWDTNDLNDVNNIKNVDDIKSSFKTICELTPYYKIVYDDDAQNYKTQLIYQPASTAEIDALTGQWSTIWDDMDANNGHRYYGISGVYAGAKFNNIDEIAMESEFVSGKGASFTEAEYKKIEINDSLLKGEDIKNILVNNEVIKLPANCSVSSYNVYSVKSKDGEEEFFATVSIKTDDSDWDNVSVNVNAQTGEILRYSRSLKDTPDIVLDVDKANNIAEKARKVLAPDFYQEYRPSPDDDREAWVSENGEYFETERNFSFFRYINDIEVLNEAMNIRVDSLGNVLEYSCTRTDVDFIEPDIMDTDEAFDKLYEQKEFDLYYDCWVSENGKLNTYLIYKMSPFTLDAITGDIVDEWGPFYNNNDDEYKLVEYTDIKGIPQEEKIKELQKYNILLSDTDKFEPNEVVTKKEFESVLGKVLNKYYHVRKNNQEKEENLTNKLAAAVYTSYYDSDRLAYIPGIFKSPFSDVSDDDEYVGCFAIANAKGFMAADSNNNIDPDKELSRANVIDLLYGYILAVQQ